MIEFLLDYYVWILAVLGIVIVTIIGFLVDSKQKRKKKKLGEVTEKVEVQTVEPLPEDVNKDDSPIMDAKTEQVPQMVDNVIGKEKFDKPVEPLQPNTNESFIQPVQQVQNNPIEVDSQLRNNINQNISLSEQKPHFETKEVVMPAQSQTLVNNENFATMPQPVKPVLINQSAYPQAISQPNQQQYYGNFVQQQANQNYNNINNQTINNAQQIQTQNAISSNLAYANNQTVNYQNVPKPIPSSMTAQPAMQMPNTMVNQPITTPVQTNQVSNSQTEAKIPDFGINFVTGETANKQNDDNWNL